MFEARLPARKFRKYVCVGRHAASEEKIVAERDGEGEGSSQGERKSEGEAQVVWRDGKGGVEVEERVRGE